MGDTFRVKIIHSKNNLGVNFGSLSLFDSFLVDNLLKQITSLSVLHDKIKLFGSLNNLIQLYYKGMSQFFHDFKFPSDSNNICVLEDKIFL